MFFPSLRREGFNILQINIGYVCNQVCSHCHVNAGPHRVELMNSETLNLVKIAMQKYNIETLDITGGAPEMHPDFRQLVKYARNLGIEVIDRCNLTILKEEGYEGLSDFLASKQVRVVASLPCYLEENVDNQRGKGVFEKSIKALQELNSYGYGNASSNLKLDLVFNPIGPKLPPPQLELEKEYRKELYRKYGIYFNQLFTITNMPINRFATYLKSKGQLENYEKLLYEAHNDNNLDKVMCKNLISVDWKGNLYDCDFNQQLNLPILGNISSLKDLLSSKIDINNYPINTKKHCYGCTAGVGSSCGGQLT